MFRNMLKSKIYRATVTDAKLEYEGSITIDAALAEAAGLVADEKVLIADMTNGARLETYVIIGERNSGIIQINGAAAHLVKPKDQIIILAFALVSEEELAGFQPRKIKVDAKNRKVN